VPEVPLNSLIVDGQNGRRSLSIDHSKDERHHDEENRDIAFLISHIDRFGRVYRNSAAIPPWDIA
jgi:hypothetical protein